MNDRVREAWRKFSISDWENPGSWERLRQIERREALREVVRFGLSVLAVVAVIWYVLTCWG